MPLITAIKQRTFASLKIRNYRLYFFGQGISAAGTWMQTVALGWLALELTGSGTQLGGIIALQFLPILLFGAWGGVISDSFDRRKTIICLQSAFAILAFILGVLVLTGLIQVWMLYVFALSYGFVRAIDEPVRSSFISEMVDSIHMKNAVSLVATLNNLARVVGPAIGGVLIASVGIAACFILNALSYAAVIGMILVMRESELHRSDKKPDKSANVKDGFRYCMETPVIRNILFMAAIVGTFAWEWPVSLPLLAQRAFNGDATSYASLMSSLGVGAVIGGLVAASRHKISALNLIVFAFLLGVSMIAAAFMPTLQLAMLGVVVVGFFLVSFASLANAMIQLESVPEMRGRAMSFWSVTMLGSTAIGGPIIGLIGEHVGARWGLAGGGISALVAAGIAAYPLLTKHWFRVIPEDAQFEDSSSAEDIK